MSDRKKIKSNIRINKVYTKNGDSGKTNLIGGSLVDKDDLRIEAYGTVDELQAIIGLCIVNIEKLNINKNIKNNSRSIYHRIQNELFNLGSSLSRVTINKNLDVPMVSKENITELEIEMDEVNKSLPELTSFVLPGGSEINVTFHIARTVCRRAERYCVTLSKESNIDANVIPYLNRLSDHLFVFSRWFSKLIGSDENLWNPKL
tara:strand:+ start:509 stop:1120 length:612 start_codon:yes stop_codon:yes gene_type:complete